MCIQSENVKTVENEVDEKKSGFTVQKKPKRSKRVEKSVTNWRNFSRPSHEYTKSFNIYLIFVWFSFKFTTNLVFVSFCEFIQCLTLWLQLSSVSYTFYFYLGNSMLFVLINCCHYLKRRCFVCFCCQYEAPLIFVLYSIYWEMLANILLTQYTHIYCRF